MEKESNLSTTESETTFNSYITKDPLVPKRQYKKTFSSLDDMKVPRSPILR